MSIQTCSGVALPMLRTISAFPCICKHIYVLYLTAGIEEGNTEYRQEYVLKNYMFTIYKSTSFMEFSVCVLSVYVTF